MTLRHTLEIPDTRRIIFDVPREIPTGKAQVEFKVIPFVKKEEKPEPPLKCLIGVDTSRVDRLIGIIPNPENKTYDELRMEGMMEKYGEYFK